MTVAVPRARPGGGLTARHPLFLPAMDGREDAECGCEAAFAEARRWVEVRRCPASRPPPRPGAVPPLPSPGLAVSSPVALHPAAQRERAPRVYFFASGLPLSAGVWVSARSPPQSPLEAVGAAPL